MGKLRSCKVKCLASLKRGQDLNSGTLALVYGINHFAVLYRACFLLAQMMWVCTTSHERRKGLKEICCFFFFFPLQNSVHIREWGSIHGNLGSIFPPKIRKDFFIWQSYPVKERATLGRNESFHHQDIKYFLGAYMAVILLKGFRDCMQSWHGCCLKSLGMSSCDPMIWLQSSNTQSASKGLIIYSYTVRCFQERFPCSILISTL